MKAILLLIHIALGVISLGFAAHIGIGTIKDITKVSLANVKRMWYSVAGAMISGVVLGVVAKAPFGRTCVALLSLSTVILLVHLFQKSVRLRTSSAYPDRR